MRRVICPDKVTTAQWLAVHDAAHRVGLRSNVTLMFGHVETPRSVGSPSPPRARAAAALGRIHRVRAAALRPDGGADLPPGSRATRADVPRDAARPRCRATRTAPGDHERPGLVGQARAGGHAAGARGRRERPRRHADERVDLTLGRRGLRAGDAAGANGGADPVGRPRRRASARRSMRTRPPSGDAPRSGRRRSPSRRTRR